MFQPLAPVQEKHRGGGENNGGGGEQNGGGRGKREKKHRGGTKNQTQRRTFRLADLEGFLQAQQRSSARGGGQAPRGSGGLNEPKLRARGVRLFWQGGRLFLRKPRGNQGNQAKSREKQGKTKRNPRESKGIQEGMKRTPRGKPSVQMAGPKYGMWQSNSFNLSDKGLDHLVKGRTGRFTRMCAIFGEPMATSKIRDMAMGQNPDIPVNIPIRVHSTENPPKMVPLVLTHSRMAAFFEGTKRNPRESKKIKRKPRESQGNQEETKGIKQNQEKNKGKLRGNQGNPPAPPPPPARPPNKKKCQVKRIMSVSLFSDFTKWWFSFWFPLKSTSKRVPSKKEHPQIFCAIGRE